MLAFSEAVLLAEKGGVPRERAVEAVLGSVAASPRLQYRGPFVLKMPEVAWGSVRMMAKDLRLALDLGRTAGVPLPSTALTHELYPAAHALGLGGEDMTALFDVLARLSGLRESARG